MADLLLLETLTDELLLENNDSLELDAVIVGPAVFIWFIEIPITSTGGNPRTIDKSQVLFGASLILSGSLDMDYFRRHLNDVLGIDL